MPKTPGTVRVVVVTVVVGDVGMGAHIGIGWPFVTGA